MKKLTYIGKQLNKDFAYFQMIGRSNRLALTESTLEYLLKHPGCFKLGPADMVELKRGLRAFQI